MKKRSFGARNLRRIARCCVAIVCSGLLVPSDVVLWAHTRTTGLAPARTALAPAPQTPGAADQEAAKLPPDQLDSLVAPIALYPDPMLAQVLAASTYPLEVIQLQQWLAKHKDLKDKALADEVAKQPWDPSVQGLAGLPDVVKLLSDDIAWTTDLGNAFLAQQSDVMNAVQRMRAKAQGQGNLKSNEQIKVVTQTVESKQVIVVEQANPQVVYVPSYNPTVVYGPPVYPYPPIAYPPVGYYAAGMAISFGVGVAMGAIWSGGWGYNCGWHGGNNNITINNSNNFNRNTNINAGNRNNINSGNRGGNTWQHNPQHRGGTPYGDRGTANKYGGTTRGASASARQAQARQNQASRMQAGNRPGQQPVGGSRSGPGVSDRSANRPSGGGDRIGNRSTSPSASSHGNAFGGGSGGRTGSSAMASSTRGSSSMGSRAGGGARAGGGRRR